MKKRWSFGRGPHARSRHMTNRPLAWTVTSAQIDRLTGRDSRQLGAFRALLPRTAFDCSPLTVMAMLDRGSPMLSGVENPRLVARQLVT